MDRIIITDQTTGQQWTLEELERLIEEKKVIIK